MNRMLLVIAILSVFQVGCRIPFYRHHDPFALDGRCTIPKGTSPEDLVSMVSERASQMPGWKCTQVWVSSRGATLIPVKLSGMLAVEKSSSFRLMVQSPAGVPFADLGSNSERFWYWFEQAEPNAVYTCKHEQSQEALARLPIPFEPLWLIDALGVVPIDLNEVEITEDPGDTRKVIVVRQRISPQGDPLKQVIVIDRCHALVREHRLFDGTGRLLAEAKLLEYRTDPNSPFPLPHRIEIDWPQRDLNLTLDLKDIEITKSIGMSENLFQMPDIPNAPIYNIGGGGRRRGLPRSSSTEEGRIRIRDEAESVEPIEFVDDEGTTEEELESEETFPEESEKEEAVTDAAFEEGESSPVKGPLDDELIEQDLEMNEVETSSTTEVVEEELIEEEMEASEEKIPEGEELDIEEASEFPLEQEAQKPAASSGWRKRRK